MPATVVYNDRSVRVSGAVAEGESLWIPTAELKESIGWELKPQGACLGDTCVPIPATRSSEFFRDSGSVFNLAALGRLLGQSVVHDSESSVWVFGEPAETRRTPLESLTAPDFELPDLDGKMHRLSDYRGKKVFLFAWGSW